MSTQLELLLPKLTALEQALLDRDPKMPTHLREIHKSLVQYEELSHLLTEEQIGIIVSAQCQQVSVTLAQETKASKGSKKKVTADDL